MSLKTDFSLLATDDALIDTYAARGIVQKLYPDIAKDGPMHKHYVRLFIELMTPFFDPAALQDNLDDAQLQTLREAVFQATLEDVSIDAGLKGSTDPTNRYNLLEDYHIIQLLEPPTDGAPYDEVITYGALCFAIDNHREGCGTFQRALDLQPDNVFALTSLAYMTDCACFPRFRMSFVSRCLNAWKATADVLKKYEPGRTDRGTMEASIVKTFQIWTRLHVSVVTYEGGGGALAFSPVHWDRYFFLTQLAIQLGEDELPEAIKKDWDLEIRELPMATISDENGNSVFDASQIKTALVDTPDHNGVRVCLYAPELTQYTSNPTVQEKLTEEVMSVLDFPDYCILVRSVEILSKRPRSFTGTIATLEDQLLKLGYTIGHEIEEIESLVMRRTYTRRPKESARPRLRDDIIQGETTLWRLQEEYECHQTDMADYFMTRGAGPVFLAWPRSIMDCGEAEFYRRLQNALSGEDVKDNFKILGRARGTQYCYLDLLLWSTPHFVQAIEAYAAKIPGGDQFRIQSFYWDAYPCPVSMDYIQQRSSINTHGSPYLEVHPAKPSKPQPAPKNKKKNAAKAKRKHQKKFH